MIQDGGGSDGEQPDTKPLHIPDQATFKGFTGAVLFKAFHNSMGWATFLSSV